MKITVIGMVKNSADVIETFIRANGLYADNFVLINNNSSDRTEEILGNLVSEGYSIDLFSDNENAYLQSMKMNILIKKVVEKYGSDWIIPLDDDEILVSSNGGDVRSEIESWNPDNSYFAKWRIYIPVEDDDYNEICVAKRQRYIFDDSLVSGKKIIFSKRVANSDDFRIVQGNHDFVGMGSKKTDQTKLVIAHFPVRSPEQIISKALVGWTNYLAMPLKKRGNGEHWKRIYDMCKSSFSVDIDSMWEICVMYLKEEVDVEELKIECKPLIIDKDALIIRYTNVNEVNPILNYIENVENLAQSYAGLMEKEMS